MDSLGLGAFRDPGRGRGGRGSSRDDGSLCRKRDSSRTPSRDWYHRRDSIAGRTEPTGPARPGLRRHSDRARNTCDRIRMGAALAASCAQAVRVVLGADGEWFARFATKRLGTPSRPGFSILIIVQAGRVESRPGVPARGTMSHQNRVGEVCGVPDSTEPALVRAGCDGIHVAPSYAKGPRRAVPWLR